MSDPPTGEHIERRFVPTHPFTAPTRYRWELGGIILLALLLRVWLFVGYALVDPMDDGMYVAQSELSATKRLEAVDAIAEDYVNRARITNERIVLFRVGVLLPIRWARSLLADQEIAAAIPSLMASLGTVILIFWLGQMWLNPRAGRWASLLFALCPLDLVLSTRILSSSIHLFWFTGAIAWLVVSEMHPPRSANGRRAAVVAAACWFLAYLSRRTAILALPIVLGWALLSIGEKNRPRFGAFLGASAILWTLEASYYLLTTGVFALSTLAEAHGHVGTFQGDVAKYSFGPWLTVHCMYYYGVPHHFFKLALGIVEHYGGLKLFAAYAPLAVAASALAVFQRRLRFPVWWMIAVFVYFQYGFIGLERDPGTLHWNYYLVFPRLRYLALLLPPLCLLGANLIMRLERSHRALAGAVLATVVATSLYHGVVNHRFYRGSLADLRAAAAFVDGLETRGTSEDVLIVYSDQWAIPRLEFLSQSEGIAFRILHDGIRPPPESVVIVGGSRGYELAASEVVQGLGPVFTDLFYEGGRSGAPEGYREVFRHEGPRMPQRQSDLVVYRVESIDESRPLRRR